METLRLFFNRDTLTFVVPVVLALCGYLFTYNNSRLAERRAARLKRVNDQLRQLYGPLYSLSLASEAAWNAFMDKHAPGDRDLFKPGRTLTPDEVTAWRLWIRTVILPMNAQMDRIIRENWDLIEDAEIQQPFVQLLAHFCGYLTIVESWNEGVATENRPDVRFPAEVNELIRKHHDILRSRQKALLGLRGG